MRVGLTIRAWFTAAALLLGAVAAMGCNSGLNFENPDGGVPATVTATGVINGMFTVSVQAIYNPPDLKNITAVTIHTTGANTLGIKTFSVTAYLTGPPQTVHYDQMAGMIFVSLTLNDGRTFLSDVNSNTHLYIDTIPAMVSQPDGSVDYTIHGSALGTALSTEMGNSDLLTFTMNF